MKSTSEILEHLKADIKQLSSREAAAKACNIHRVTLSRYLNGSIELPLSVFLTLCDHLGKRASDYADEKIKVEIIHVMSGKLFRELYS